MGSSPTTGTKKAPPPGVLFWYMERDSKGAGVNDVPVARQSRAPARPQAGSPTTGTKKAPPPGVLFWYRRRRREPEVRSVSVQKYERSEGFLANANLCSERSGSQSHFFLFSKNFFRCDVFVRPACYSISNQKIEV